MKYDLSRLKEPIDLRRLVEEDLGPSKMRGGQAQLWKCPLHQERHGYSLAVWPDGWRCFGTCQTGGDVLDWLQRYRGLTFTEACETLGAEAQRGTHPRSRLRSVVIRLTEAEPPNLKWQRDAAYVVERAQAILWSEVGLPARTYLHRRGLTAETILRARLGYLPGRLWERRAIRSLSVPSGILIPWYVGQELWAVKVRRAAGLPKYIQIAGGSAQGLYNAAALEGHEIVLLVEGEFDALLAAQESGGQLGVATLGSASTTLNARWLSMLIHCRKLLICYDADEAGQKGAARLQAMTHRAQIVRLPWGKDITEFVMQGGSVAQWLNANL